jgi:hypothetical protein
LLLSLGCSALAAPGRESSVDPIDRAVLAETADPPASGTTTPVPAAAVTAAAAAVVAEFTPLITTLPRSIDVYHWVDRPRLGVPSTGVVDPTLPAVANHLATWGKFFLDPKQAVSNTHRYGFYAANDPVFTVGFGGSAFALFRVRLPVGFRYLDISATQDQDVSPATAKLLAAAGCTSTQRLAFVFINTSTACRDVLLAALKPLAVSGLGYAWSSVPFRDCATRGPLTFVLFGDGIPADAVAFFTADVPTPDPVHDERAAINGMFSQASGWGSPPWPALNGEANRATQWMRDHLLYCGAK